MLARLNRDPIARAEAAYLERTRRRSQPHGWRAWLRRLIVRLPYLFALQVALIIIGAEFVGALTLRQTAPIHNALGVLPVVVVAVALSLHLAGLVRTVGSAANSIARERQNGTWDLLLLTNVSAAQIVRGKWWATLRAQTWQLAWLVPLRAAIPLYVAWSLSRLSAYLSSSAYQITPPHPLALAVVVVVIAALTWLSLAFAAAVGVLAGALFRRWGAAMAAGVALYVVVCVVGTLLVLMFGSLSYTSVIRTGDAGSYEAAYAVQSFASIVGVSIADNGLVAPAQFIDYDVIYLSNPGYMAFELNREQIDMVMYFAGNLVYVALVVGMIALLLALARRSLQRQGAG